MNEEGYLFLTDRKSFMIISGGVNIYPQEAENVLITHPKVTDVAVFRRAYGLVGWGWLYAPTRWPLVGPVVDALYSWWAAKRLQLTRRPSLDQLCDSRCDITTAPAEVN